MVINFEKAFKSCHLYKKVDFTFFCLTLKVINKNYADNILKDTKFSAFPKKLDAKDSAETLDKKLQSYSVFMNTWYDQMKKWLKFGKFTKDEKILHFIEYTAIPSVRDDKEKMIALHKLHNQCKPGFSYKSAKNAYKGIFGN